MKTLIFTLILRGQLMSDVGCTMYDAYHHRTSYIQHRTSIDSLPSPAALFDALRAFHTESDSAHVEGLKVSEKFSWLHWLPSVGITFGKPSIGFSLSQVAANIETKAQRKAQKSAILRGGILAFKTDSFALVALLQRHETFRASLPRLKAIEQIEADKFKFQTERNANGDVKPLEWLNLKADSLRSTDPLRARLEEISLLEIDIRKLARY